ncbi:MAG TPA: GrpB family protein [Verrucomicrobiae bacterium]|nr:GrpB family protein [Verrucomicrobiae bacterium]
MPDRNLPPGLIGGSEKRTIVITDYDPQWPTRYQEHATRINQAVGSSALQIEHIGSTSVPGLGSKPIIDILLVVKDAANEEDYLPSLEAAGYVLRVREPDFDQHRMFRTPERDVHVHVFGKDSKEIARYLNFRDHLRRHDADRRNYEALKRELATRDWPHMDAYAAAKGEFIESIIAKARSPANH